MQLLPWTLVCDPLVQPAAAFPTGPLCLQGFDITPDLRRMCPSLTLQQIYKLTEHHHDDWITGGQASAHPLSPHTAAAALGLPAVAAGHVGVLLGSAEMVAGSGWLCLELAEMQPRTAA